MARMCVWAYDNCAAAGHGSIDSMGATPGTGAGAGAQKIQRQPKTLKRGESSSSAPCAAYQLGRGDIRAAMHRKAATHRDCGLQPPDLLAWFHHVSPACLRCLIPACPCSDTCGIRPRAAVQASSQPVGQSVIQSVRQSVHLSVRQPVSTKCPAIQQVGTTCQHAGPYLACFSPTWPPLPWLTLGSSCGC